MVSLRCFIAVEIPPMIRRKLSWLARDLDPKAVLRVNEENMHITLKFLGEVSQDKIEAMRSKLRTVSFKPFRLVIRGAGAFPNDKYVRVLWVGCESEELSLLAKDINKVLEKLFKPEEFTAHITVARIRKKLDVHPFMVKCKGQTFGEFTVESFALKASQLTGSGPVYSTVEEFSVERKRGQVE